MNPPFELSQYPDLYTFPNNLSAHNLYGEDFEFYKVGDSLAGPGSKYVEAINDAARLQREGITILSEPEEGPDFELAKNPTPEEYEENLAKVLEALTATPSIKDHLNKISDLLYTNVKDPETHASFSRVASLAFALSAFDLKGVHKLNLTATSKHAWEVDYSDPERFFNTYSSFLNARVLSDKSGEYYFCSVLKDSGFESKINSPLSTLVIAHKQGLFSLSFSKDLGYSIHVYDRNLSPGCRTIGNYIGSIIWNKDSADTLYTLIFNEHPGSNEIKTRSAIFSVKTG